MQLIQVSWYIILHNHDYKHACVYVFMHGAYGSYTLLSVLFCSVEYKENFSKLSQLVLIGGPDDGVITPWQSRYACMYANRSTVKSHNINIIPVHSIANSDFTQMEQTKIHYPIHLNMSVMCTCIYICNLFTVLLTISSILKIALD